MTVSKLRLTPAERPDAKQSETTVESILTRVFIVLFVQLQCILFVFLITGVAPAFVERFRFQVDFIGFFNVTSDWIHGVDPYLNTRFVTPPPSLLVALPVQFFGLLLGSMVFMCIDLAIIAKSLSCICKWFKLTPRESLLLFGIASMYFPVMFLVERGNLDGIMLGLILVSLFARNRWIKAFALSLSIGIKVYSILLLAPLMLARLWKRATAVVLLLALLMLPFHSLIWNFVISQTRRSAQLFGAENICPIALLCPIDVFGVWQHYALSHAVTLVYLALWIASYAMMLYKNRNSDLTVKSIYSLPWMLAMPLQVFPYTGVLLLPLLVLKSREIAERGLINLPDRLFLMGFCLVGFQQTAFSPYYMHPLLVRLFDAFNPLGTALVIGSLVLQSSNRNQQADTSLPVTAG